MINELNNRSTDPPYERIDDISELSARRRNSRLLFKETDDSTNFDPIIGYAQEPILPLIDACLPLVDIVHDIIVYAKIAFESTPDEPADDLTRDESASIHLYTMEWPNSHESLYSSLNRTLRTSDREKLRPWFKYLKLFLIALVKIPCNPPQTVWRGIKKNTSAEFPKGAQIIWWACSSTTTSLNVLESDLYLGRTGERTLFSIEIINGRSICEHSHYANEEEILLLPGTYMEVQSQFDPAPGLHIIHLKQMAPDHVLLEPPFEGACLYPKRQRSWCTKKRIWIPLSVLAIICVVGAILGAVFGLKSGVRRPDAFVNWNGNNWAYMCDFHENSFLNVTTLPDACGERCSTTQGCTHFAWITSNGGTCLLKTGNVSKDDAFVTNDPTMVCGIVYNTRYRTGNSTITWNEGDWATSCDFIDNDFANATVKADVCGPTCVQTQGCTHFTWSWFNGGTCWMKRGNVLKSDAFLTDDSTMVCGIINSTQRKEPNATVMWHGDNWAMSCDFTGNNFLNITSTAKRCGPTCAQTQGCTHFTWSSLNGGTCWMKRGSVSKSDAFLTYDSTMACGIIHSSQRKAPNATVLWNGNNWAMSCDFIDNDFANATVKADVCGLTCVQTQGCTHFTWSWFNGGTCWMKRGNVLKSDAFLTTDSTMVCGII